MILAFCNYYQSFDSEIKTLPGSMRRFWLFDAGAIASRCLNLFLRFIISYEYLYFAGYHRLAPRFQVFRHSYKAPRAPQARALDLVELSWGDAPRAGISVSHVICHSILRWLHYHFSLRDEMGWAWADFDAHLIGYAIQAMTQADIGRDALMGAT